MRAVLLLLALSACAPDIVSGAYLCGPEASCPEDQVCNGPDNICVLPGSAMPFACGATNDVEPNNSSSAAQALQHLNCVSTPVSLKGCVPADDGEDWYGFDVPPECGPTVVTMRVAFPLAFEQVALSIDGADASEDQCERGLSADAGDEQICIEHTVTAGQHYTFRVARSGAGDCGGDCGFNRYTLSLQLGTP